MQQFWCILGKLSGVDASGVMCNPRNICYEQKKSGKIIMDKMLKISVLYELKNIKNMKNSQH